MPEEESPNSRSKTEAAAAGAGNGHSENELAAGSIDREMEELRRLLIGNEEKQIAGLQAKLVTLANFEEDGQVDALGRELPQAIAYHNRDNTKLANALGPTIEKTLSLSIRRNPQPLVDAIFPAIGPAIRRSIKEALQSVIDSMNRVMEHSLSIQSLKWRIEAVRTGRTFSEVMLAHTLNYRVEQLFLIDKKSGLLIQHLFAESVEIKDGDIVSSMLNAIQDFVRDSLGATREDVLDTIEMGELTVMVEPGPDAILAAVIRGIPASELRTTLKEIIEAIHLQYGHILDDFDGDTDPFVPVLPLMRAGLIENYKKKERRKTRAWLIAGLIGLCLLVWFAWSFRNFLLWNGYLESLRSEPGLVVTRAYKEGGRFVVEGLRDPIAADPGSLLPDALSPDRVLGVWEPYLALDSAIIVKRVARQLQAPAGVAFRVEKDTLFAFGAADRSWVVSARGKAPFIPGITAYNDLELTGLDGSADLAGVIDEIESASIAFAQGSAVLTSDLNDRLDELVASMRLLQELSSTEGKDLHVFIYGYVSTEGTATTNKVLSMERAERVRDALVSRGLPAEIISTVGTGDPRLPGIESSEAERAMNRSVTFEVVQR